MIKTRNAKAARVNIKSTRWWTDEWNNGYVWNSNIFKSNIIISQRYLTNYIYTGWNLKLKQHLLVSVKVYCFLELNITY